MLQLQQAIRNLLPKTCHKIKKTFKKILVSLQIIKASQKYMLFITCPEINDTKHRKSPPVMFF